MVCVCYIAYANEMPEETVKDLPPAPGETSSRSASTELNYLRRALWFASHAAKNLGLDEPTPVEVVTYALSRRPVWSKSTWRQTKASLLHRYESMGTAIALEAVRLLREQGDQSPCLPTTKRTSGMRAKKISEKAFTEIIRKVRASESVYSAMLESWLIMGSLCGLRPHEWTQADVIWAPPSEIDPLDPRVNAPGNLDLERPYLKVLNAKTSNGRSFGIYRHLDLSGMSMLMLGAVERFCEAMRRLKDEGNFEACLKRCQMVLYRINSSARLDGMTTPKWIQIYSSRHVFSSKAKKNMQPHQVSALMGHGTDRTAHSHYGRRTNEGGGVGVMPVEAEVAMVRKKRKSYADAVLAARARQPSQGQGPAAEAAA